MVSAKVSFGPCAIVPLSNVEEIEKNCAYLRSRGRLIPKPYDICELERVAQNILWLDLIVTRKADVGKKYIQRVVRGMDYGRQQRKQTYILSKQHQSLLHI